MRSVREWRSPGNLHFAHLRWALVKQLKQNAVWQRKGPYEVNKSCSLAQLDELAADISEEALLLDGEERISSNVQVRGRLCGKASEMSKNYACT